MLNRSSLSRRQVEQYDTRYYSCETGRAIVANENLAGICTRATATKVGNQGAANRRGQRQHQRSRGLRALHPDNASAPIDVVQAKINDLSSAKAIHSEADRVITTAIADRRSMVVNRRWTSSTLIVVGMDASR